MDSWLLTGESVVVLWNCDDTFGAPSNREASSLNSNTCWLVRALDDLFCRSGMFFLLSAVLELSCDWGVRKNGVGIIQISHRLTASSMVEYCLSELTRLFYSQQGSWRADYNRKHQDVHAEQYLLTDKTNYDIAKTNSTTDLEEWCELIVVGGIRLQYVIQVWTLLFLYSLGNWQVASSWNHICL